MKRKNTVTVRVSQDERDTIKSTAMMQNAFNQSDIVRIGALYMCKIIKDQLEKGEPVEKIYDLILF